MKRIPLLSVLLGGCSPLPLLLMVFIMFFYQSTTSIPVLMTAFMGYAGILLSFIGGVNWILAMQKPVIIVGNADNSIDNKRLLLAVIPCIFGEVAIILGANHYVFIPVIILMVGFALLLFYERSSYLLAELPVGYLSIRWYMTFVVEACLLGVLLARMI